VCGVDREIELTGGRVTGGVVRLGDTVHRPVGPWTATVHAYLGHLEERGFCGAPRVVGFDDRGREVLTYVEGVVPSSSTWERGHANRVPREGLTEEALVVVARLIRSLHEASADFRPPEPVWREYAHPMLPAEIVCHGDLGPHNTVYRDGRPVAFIDWDGARPNQALLELGHAAWSYVPLADEVYCREMGFDEPPDRGRRMRRFAEAYGAGGLELLDAVREAKQREAERPRYWPGMTAAIVADFLSHIVSELEWLAANEESLRVALS
jgi:Phosphotransferase enzyme family